MSPVHQGPPNEHWILLDTTKEYPLTPCLLIGSLSRDIPGRKRLEHRSTHFAEVAPKFTANGSKIVMGGGIFDSNEALVADGSVPLPPFADSALIVRVDTRSLSC
ncbi:hypothetical protein BABINDRAFT_6571 [Babjeviella inositovora NRRL Y-12698]|uniref:Uncharacterized protein n=1 Tax=Babjeviella inositovora NRRL Y-12698 TaxID=984486 RepID=A0A1E3QWA5_9ASCO|nr:uncharacterized protein BABINDRAFT_6571 [Babjeviella inositovora NRRL Y-12698]ODQ81945.1 hypothetical protein BABINDRAFT_6571 [Babjeviella inositovora NRRL Y-12698]